MGASMSIVVSINTNTGASTNMYEYMHTYISDIIIGVNTGMITSTNTNIVINTT